MIEVQYINANNMELQWRTFTNPRKAKSFADKLALDPNILDVEVLD